jgi:hypothetical protein
MKALHILNCTLWLAQVIVSAVYAQNAGLMLIGGLGAVLAAGMFWCEP